VVIDILFVDSKWVVFVIQLEGRLFVSRTEFEAFGGFIRCSQAVAVGCTGGSTRRSGPVLVGFSTSPWSLQDCSSDLGVRRRIRGTILGTVGSGLRSRHLE
jgi:hypothetical protein